MSVVGDNIKVLRKQKGLTIQELSELSSVGKGTISEIETGSSKNPGLVTLEQLAAALGTKIEDLLQTSEQRVARWKNNLERLDNIEDKCKYLETVVEFAEPKDAVKFILAQPSFMAYGGYDLDKLSDEEVLDIANDMVFALRLSLEKLKNKK